jgi:hypothetical protein
VTTPSGRLRALVVKTATGSESIPSSVVRTSLGLRSTWLTVGVLRLDRASAGTVVFGGSARLAGISRGVGTPRLGSSPDGSSWATAVAVTLDTTGALTADVKPVRTTRYRLEAEGAASPALLVQVAPRITLARSDADLFTLRGTARPRIRGVVVAIERRKGTSWVAVGQTTIDAAGAFVFELDAVVPAGSYRARVPASPGYAAGTSPVLEVVG